MIPYGKCYNDDMFTCSLDFLFKLPFTQISFYLKYVVTLNRLAD